MSNNGPSVFFKWLKRFIIVVILVSCIFIIKQLFFSQHDVKISQPERATDKSIKESELALVENRSAAQQTKTDSFAYCEDLTNDYNKDSYTWAKESYPQWDQYFQQGYSLDDVTLVVEYFTNSNFAAEFRVEQLRKNSKLTRFNREINDKLKEVAPSLIEDLLGFSLTKAIPAPELENFTHLSATDKSLILQTVSPSVDDLAYFIHQPDVLDDDILTLLAKTPNPSDIVGYDRLEAVSLLDYAVEAVRPAVVIRLLELGLQPTDDHYLGSTMEWALTKLAFTDNNKDAANIVLMLQNQGAAARFTEKSSNYISGSFPRRYYEFKAANINDLVQKYGLDLMQIQTREAFTTDNNQAINQEATKQLVKILKQKQIETVTSQLDIQNLSVQLEDCQTTIDKIKNAWIPQEANTIVANIVAKFPDALGQIISELASIDPVLVDYYLANYQSKTRKQRSLEGIESYFIGLNADNIQDVINQLLELPLTDANKNYLFSQLLTYKTKFYEPLMHSALLLDEIQYFNYYQHRLMTPKALETLVTLGASVFDSDSRGKTLLFYAAEKGDIEQLSYMTEAGFPFAESDVGEDPLHVALSLGHYHFPVEKLPDIVDILMAYQPEIDSFHLSRMAAIKLKYPNIYQHIVSNYPQLTVSADVPFPAVR